MAVNLFAMTYELVWEDPDVFVVRVPFAHFGLDHTNCYIVRDGDDVLVIDAGVKSPAAAMAFTHAAATIGIDITCARFFCTHLHFDHVALLRGISRPGSTIVMGRRAFEQNPWNQFGPRSKAVRELLCKEGITRLATLGFAAIMAEARVCDLPRRQYDLVDDGQQVRVGRYSFTAIETPGHSSGHVCLYGAEQKILFSGDHILETITPGLSLPFEGNDTLDDYLQGLDKVQTLDCRAVLPGHGEAFYELGARCDNLRDHHEMRLAQVREAIGNNPGANGAAIMRALSWLWGTGAGDDGHVALYLRLSIAAQTLAYLEHLVRTDEVVRTEDALGRHYRLA